MPKIAKKNLSATVSSAPPEVQQAQEMIPIQLDDTPPGIQEQPQDPQFVIEELNAPIDPLLENFLKMFDPVMQQEAAPNANQEQVATLPAPQPPMPLQEVQNNQQHTVNMSVNNVQNFNPNRVLPAMYFPQSNVTINYNFGK